MSDPELSFRRLRHRLRQRIERRRRAAERMAVDLLGLPEGLPDAEVQVPMEEAGIAWRGDQAYPQSGFPQDRVNGGFDRQGRYRIENLRWGYDTEGERPMARFFPSELDLSGLTGVSTLLYRFPPRRLAGHPVLVLEFSGERPVTNLRTGETSCGLVVSAEARTLQGQNWGFLPATLGFLPGLDEYPVIFVLSTLEDYQQRLFELYRKRSLEHFDLALSSVEARRVADVALTRALSDHRHLRYRMTRRNCATGYLDTLIEALGEDRVMRRRHLGGLMVDLRASAPGNLLRLLRKAGLVVGPTRRLTPPPP